MATDVARLPLPLPAAPRKARACLAKSTAGRWVREGLPTAPLALARTVLAELALWTSAAADLEERAPATLSPQLLLARIPRHVQPYVFAAYCAWLCDPHSTAGQQFDALLEVSPWLDLAVFRHAGHAVPHLAASWPQWRETVALGIRDAASGEKLVQALQATLPCPARRVLHF